MALLLSTIAAEAGAAAPKHGHRVLGRLLADCIGGDAPATTNWSR